jgi:two-component system sensor histidine kinase BaeS
MSMRWRLLGAFGVIILVALATVAVVSRFTTQQEVQEFLGHGGQVGLESLANDLESYYKENGVWTGLESLPDTGAGAGIGQGQGNGQGRRGSSNASNSQHILTDPDGVVLISPSAEDLGKKLGEDILAQSITLTVSGQVVGYLIPEDGLAQLPDDFEEILIERVNRSILISALISGSIAILLAFIFAALILRPVRGLTRAAKDLSQGDLSQRVRVRGKGELAALGKTFNQMADSLQAAESNRLAMTADIAHELRNPLAIQRAHLEALQDGVYSMNSENLTPVLKQNYQLSRLVEDLRTLALADAGELVLHKQRINFSEVCRDTIDRFEPQAISKTIKLSCECGSEEIFVEADRERIQQVLDNLMQNAFRYAPESGVITLKLKREGDRGVAAVHNNGPQIPDDVLRHLFERFYREDKARDRASGGTGLGLAIARKLAEAHGGALSGENDPAGGVAFILTLPALPS